MKIEKGIPVPKVGDAMRKFPFDQMEVGDSFLINGAEPGKVSGAAYHYGRTHQKKFSIQKTEDGHRCWRIA